MDKCIALSILPLNNNNKTDRYECIKKLQSMRATNRLLRNKNVQLNRSAMCLADGHWPFEISGYDPHIKSEEKQKKNGGHRFIDRFSFRIMARKRNYRIVYSVNWCLCWKRDPRTRYCGWNLNT